MQMHDHANAYKTDRLTRLLAGQEPEKTGLAMRVAQISHARNLYATSALEPVLIINRGPGGRR
jgi:hypothetical protein